jgi:hypothetical protein
VGYQRAGRRRDTITQSYVGKERKRPVIMQNHSSPDVKQQISSHFGYKRGRVGSDSDRSRNSSLDYRGLALHSFTQTEDLNNVSSGLAAKRL